MSTLESFRVVAAIAAAIATIGILAPSGAGGGARRIASMAMLCGSWALLAGSLLSRGDAERLWARIDSPARLGMAVVGLAVAVLVTAVMVRVVWRRPWVWLVLLALAMPIRIPVTLGSQSANLLLPLYCVIALGVVTVVWRAVREGAQHVASRTGLIDMPLGAFVAFSLVSMLWSQDISEATVKVVFFYIPFTLLYRLTIIWWDRLERPLVPLVGTTVLLGVLVAGLALFQYATRTIWWNETLMQGNIYNRFFRANGIFFDPNMLGRFLVIAIVCAVAYMAMSDDQRHARLLAGACALMAAGLVVSFSRSSALALLVALALVAVRVFGLKRTLLVGIGAIVLIGGPAVALNENVRGKATSIEKLAGSGEGRLRLVKGGVKLWEKEPIVGVGLGAFAERYKATLSRRDQLRTRVFISHTAPVTVLAELGAVGFGLFLVLCASAVVTMFRGARRPDGVGMAIWTILALVVAIFVHSVLYSAFFEDPYMWFLVAAAGALAALAPMLAAPARDGEVTQVQPQPTTG